MKRRDVLKNLDNAIEYLEHFLAKEGEPTRCAVPIEHREASRLYIETWVLDYVRLAREEVES